MHTPPLHAPPRPSAASRAQAAWGQRAEAAPALPPVEVPLQAPGIGAAAQAGARHAWAARKGLYALLAALSLLSVAAGAAPGPVAGPAGAALFGVALAALGLVRGLDGRGRHAAFWAGLGLSPLGWELGVMGLDLGALVGAWAVAAALGAEGTATLWIGLAPGLWLYAAASATRGSAPAEAGRALRLVGVVLGAGGAAALSANSGLAPLPAALGWPLLLTAAAGLLVRLAAAARAPESAAGRGRPRPGWLAAALSGLLALPLLSLHTPTDLTTLERGPTGALMVPELDAFASRALWWQPIGGSPERLSPRGHFVRISTHPSGAAAWRRIPAEAAWDALLNDGPNPHLAFFDRWAPLSHHGIDEVRLADGQIVSCEVQVFGHLGDNRDFSADGMRVTATEDEGRRWLIDAQGCRPADGGAP